MQEKRTPSYAAKGETHLLLLYSPTKMTLTSFKAGYRAFDSPVYFSDERWRKVESSQHDKRRLRTLCPLVYGAVSSACTIDPFRSWETHLGRSGSDNAETSDGYRQEKYAPVGFAGRTGSLDTMIRRRGSGGKYSKVDQQEE
jgi:hypothetical protein